MRVFIASALLWTAYYLLRAAVPTGPGGLPVFLFNWLFPIFLVYLLLTVGQRRR